MLELELLADDDVRTLAGALGVDARLPEQSGPHRGLRRRNSPSTRGGRPHRARESDLLRPAGGRLEPSIVRSHWTSPGRCRLPYWPDWTGSAPPRRWPSGLRRRWDLLVRLLAAGSGMQPDLLGRSWNGWWGVVSSSTTRVTTPPTPFKHALVQEATYDSLLRRNRRTIHERVARVLDAGLASGASTAPEVVALALRGGEPGL